MDKVTKLLSPRVLVLVTTKSKDGSLNAAPFSFVAPLSFSPPLVLLGVGHGKQTTKNIVETKEFVLNMVSEDWAQQAVACEEKLADRSERIEKAGLHAGPSKAVEVPRVEEAKAVLECKLHEVIEVKDSDHILIVGEIVHAECEAMKEGSPDLDELKFLMHASGNEFRKVGPRVELERKK